jgi:hypothetical protein
MQCLIQRTVFAAALMGAAAANKPTAAFAANHDGDWTVQVITEQGKCDRTSNYDVSVSNGHITYTSYTSLSMFGTVSPQGDVLVNIRHFDDGAQGNGRLTEHRGIGNWRGAGRDGVCSGRWEAYRR